MSTRDVTLQKQIAEAKDPDLENNEFDSLQTQCNLLTVQVAYLLREIRKLQG